MKFLVIVHATLRLPYSHWVEHFDADDVVRQSGGVHTIFRHPVIGEQAVVFGVEVTDPRMVHDMMYHVDVRPHIEASGLVVGSERLTICQADV